ncbi:phytanoyl-CoA dioxygenase family protein [Streptomyces longwoodensis]|uniref:phytanoyl-CoA dioxygenase family protein n=1 Tax=Streptomyces longwoodensis TaxID=68231 RepID=UPI0033F249EE
MSRTDRSRDQEELVNQQHAGGRPTGAEADDTLTTTYREDGFVVLRDALSSEEVDTLRREAVAVCRGDRGAVAGLVPARAGESDEEVIRRYVCVHFPHKISKVAHAALLHPVVVDALVRLVGPNVKAMQSMLFTKSEGKPGQAWHQDEFWIPTRDRSLTGAWIALDDATVDNGCLWVIPGSHRRGVLYPDREHDDPRFDCTVEAYAFPYGDDDAVPVEVPAGSVVLFDGYLLHRSLPNSGRRGLRRALVNHYMSAESVLPWQTPPPGVHLGKWDYRDVVLVAGEDPYAHRGTPHLSQAMVRPERDGGCAR